MRFNWFNGRFNVECDFCYVLNSTFYSYICFSFSFLYSVNNLTMLNVFLCRTPGRLAFVKAKANGDPNKQ